MIRLWLLLYLARHHDTLLSADLWAAAKLGAPVGFTLSAFAHYSARQGRLRGRFGRALIDAGWRWVFNETEHCRKSYEKRVGGKPSLW